MLRNFKKRTWNLYNQGLCILHVILIVASLELNFVDSELRL